MSERAIAYYRLKADKDYIDVRFNPDTGGLKATHVLHSFHPKRGHYEQQARDLLFDNGDAIILGKELEPRGTKITDGVAHQDGRYNESSCEIATILGTGRDGVKRALKHCAHKGAEVAIIYFPIVTTYSEERMQEGIAKYEGVKRHRFKEIVVIHNGAVHKKSHS